MMEKCTVKIADWLIKSDAINEADREIYEYAIYSILLTLSPVLLAIGFGMLFGALRQSLLIVTPFVMMRKFSGGYHTKRACTCLIGSSLLLVLCIILVFVVECNEVLLGLTALSVISLGYFSPLDNENRVLSREEQIKYKKVTIILLSGFIVLGLFFLWFGLDECMVCVSIGLILTACLQYPCILARILRRIAQKQ